MANGDLRLAAFILFSVAFYIIHFATSVAAARVSFKRNQNQVYEIIIAHMVCAHVLKIFIFCINVKIKREAMKGAYVVPLIHLRKLALFAWSKASRLPRISGKFKLDNLDILSANLAACLDAAPLLLFQSCSIFPHHVYKLSNYVHGIYSDETDLSYHNVEIRSGLSIDVNQSSTILWISCGASLLMAGYNSGWIIMSTMRKADFWARTGIYIVSAVYSASALLVRCIGFSLLTLLFYSRKEIMWRIRCCALYFGGTAVLPAVIFWRMVSGNRILHSAMYSHVSFAIGPLYPLLKIMQNTGKNNHRVAVLFGLSIARILPDIVLLVTALPKWKTILAAYDILLDACDLEKQELCSAKAAYSYWLTLGVLVHFAAICIFSLVDSCTKCAVDERRSSNYREEARRRLSKVEEIDRGHIISLTCCKGCIV